MEWCARRDLNPQPSDPKAYALHSTQSYLIQYNLIYCGVRRTVRPMLYHLSRQKLIGTKQQLAVILNLSQRRITDLIAAKIIPPRGKRGFDLVASVKGYIAFLKKPTGNLTGERARLVKAQADLRELELRKRTGEVVLRSAVEKQTFELNRQARDAMLNVPARISGILAAESDQAVVFRLLTQEIVQAMEGRVGGPGA